MSAAPSSVATQLERVGARLLHFVIGGLYALRSLLPRIAHLRHSPGSWLAFRVLLGLAGATLVVVPLGLWNSWLAAIVGLVMFLAAVLLPPPKPATTAEEKAGELGALVVVDGGEYKPENARAARVRLFVGQECIWVLDSGWEPLLAIPSSAITSMRAAELDGDWNLQISWNGRAAEFWYRGVFAQRLARAAEGSVASVIPSPTEELPQSRAAGA